MNTERGLFNKRPSRAVPGPILQMRQSRAVLGPIRESEKSGT
jgi:hypothetical protein